MSPADDGIVMKFCRDCRYCHDAQPTKRSICTHLAAMTRSTLWQVTGLNQHLSVNYSCVDMRSGICANGRLFEARDVDAEHEAKMQAVEAAMRG